MKLIKTGLRRYIKLTGDQICAFKLPRIGPPFPPSDSSLSTIEKFVRGVLREQQSNLLPFAVELLTEYNSLKRQQRAAFIRLSKKSEEFRHLMAEGKRPAKEEDTSKKNRTKPKWSRLLREDTVFTCPHILREFPLIVARGDMMVTISSFLEAFPFEKNSFTFDDIVSLIFFTDIYGQLRAFYQRRKHVRHRKMAVQTTYNLSSRLIKERQRADEVSKEFSQRSSKGEKAMAIDADLADRYGKSVRTIIRYRKRCSAPK